jgi:hypothetical protein
MSVPNNLNPKEFVEYVCINIINEPYLLKTSGVQQVIRDLYSKISAKNGTIKSFTFQDAVRLLENHLNNKIISEKMRTEESNIPKEDYLE